MYTAKMLKIKALGITCIILFGGAVFGSLYGAIYNLMDNNTKEGLIIIGISIIFWLFFITGIWLTGYCHSITITEKSVRIRSFRNELELLLKSIEYFEECSGNMILGNKTQKISFPTPDYWTGKNKKNVYSMLLHKLNENNIILKNKFRATLPFNKGFNKF